MSKDLLGDTAPPIPAMTAPLPWRVFRLNDCDWWVARTLDEAKEDAARTWGFRYVEDAENVFEEPQELDDATLDRLHFIDTDERERPVKTSRRTFRAELAQRVAAGLSKPELFACTEY